MAKPKVPAAKAAAVAAGKQNLAPAGGKPPFPPSKASRGAKAAKPAGMPMPFGKK